jgi:hypothetical protein
MADEDAASTLQWPAWNRPRREQDQIDGFGAAAQPAASRQPGGERIGRRPVAARRGKDAPAGHPLKCRMGA